MPLSTSEQYHHAYQWTEQTPFGVQHHIGKVAHTIQGEPIEDFFHDAEKDHTHYVYLMRHSHTGDLEWVGEDKLFYYYGDKQHPQPVIPGT